MKGAVNLGGLFFHLRDRNKKKAHPFASSIQLHTNSSPKFPLERSQLRQQQAAFGSPESSVDLPGSVSFPTALLVCHLVSTCSHTLAQTHTHTHTAGGESGSGSRAPAVLLIKYPKVMLKPLPSHSKASLRCENMSAVQNRQIVTQVN